MDRKAAKELLHIEGRLGRSAEIVARGKGAHRAKRPASSERHEDPSKVDGVAVLLLLYFRRCEFGSPQRN